jgi:hypothetical protein
VLKQKMSGKDLNGLIDKMGTLGSLTEVKGQPNPIKMIL